MHFNDWIRSTTFPLAFPSNYNELKILLYEDLTHVTHVFLLRKEDTNNDKIFVGGYYFKSTDCGSLSIHTGTTGIKGVYITMNETQIARDTIWLQVCYR